MEQHYNEAVSVETGTHDLHLKNLGLPMWRNSE